MILDRAAQRRIAIQLPAEAGSCLRFAAAELRRYLGEMADGQEGAGAVVGSAGDLSGAVLRCGDGPRVEAPTAPDAYHVAAAERGFTIAGDGERAVLHGVYRLLEDLGCRWSFHGRAQEAVPRLPAEGLRVRDRREEPSYRVRAYATDLYTYHYKEPEVMAERLPADVAFTDWMGKTGGNAFLFIRHPFDSQLTLPELLPEFEKRGIAPEYGGHVLPLLLPRERFAQHPEWFPLDTDGRRTDLGNLCTSGPGALAVVAAAAVEYVARHPEMDVLHIWGADLWDGGWCHCASCASLSVQDQNLRVCNAVAEALERAGRSLAVCYLAYHDTIEPDLHLRPHANVRVEFAPRERCYGHALDDPRCDVNPRYREAFERHVELFDGRVRVFEYYGDSILFCGIAVPLVQVIEADLAYYRRAGAREISFLQFGAHSLWAHPLNFLAYARSVGRSVSGSTRAGGMRGVTGDTPYGLYPAAFWSEIERALAGVVTYGDVRRPPRQRAAEILPRIEEALAALRGWIPRLGADAAAQRPLLEYTVAVLEGVCLQLAGTQTAVEEAEARYQRALDLLAAVDDRHVGVWGRRNLPVIHSFHSAASWRS